MRVRVPPPAFKNAKYWKERFIEGAQVRAVIAPSRSRLVSRRRWVIQRQLVAGSLGGVNALHKMRDG